jgi:transposase
MTSCAAAPRRSTGYTCCSARRGVPRPGRGDRREVSSGDVVRHRLSRAGDRQLNCCLRITAISQIQRDSPGRDYYLRKRAEGKGHKETMRCPAGRAQRRCDLPMSSG